MTGTLETDDDEELRIVVEGSSVLVHATSDEGTVSVCLSLGESERFLAMMQSAVDDASRGSW